MTKGNYRGRIAPSPTGFLHLGHAMTFWQAQERARSTKGKLILRIEDIDRSRCRSEFIYAIIQDLQWFGLEWDEGPDIGGGSAPYIQSERQKCYLDALEKLRAGGFIYPCTCSRKDVLGAAVAPHDELRRPEPITGGKPSKVTSQHASYQNEEPIYPGTCRSRSFVSLSGDSGNYNWRFRVPDGEQLSFVDCRLRFQAAIAGRDFGDFIVWRRDDVPAYQLAVVVDDAAMKISEVVRGEDLLLSTFRQLLVYRALDLAPPQFFHTPLVLGKNGRRLAKRDDSITLRAMRARGITPEQLRARSGVL